MSDGWRSNIDSAVWFLFGVSVGMFVLRIILESGV